ncbi:Rid family hydrolase [Arthrobacter sp. MI7-26]|uniref:Rid family hydrolase n=1 Tax=Arthrobacter sp. MI7-26 TaxID=2993653 RepID=UPI0022487913|nr:Rid family hydrolase [Arthrobacter sp. MI7-26]MCX2750045.1 Rid family hydrolase [Arthrobacter sp. MI7-26]
MSNGIEVETTAYGLPWEKDFHYSQGVKVGDTIYLSGQINHDADGNLVGVGDLEAQVRQAYANVKSVLSAYDATLANVVEDVIFVTDISAAMGIVPAVRRELFAGLTPGALTLVQVSALSFPETQVEIKCTARI